MKYLLSPILLLAIATSVQAAKSDYYVVKFGAKWCGWCQKMDKEVWPHQDIKSLVREYKEGRVYSIDADRDREWVLKYKVTALPTVIIMTKDHKAVKRLVGFADVVKLKQFLSEEPKDTTVEQIETVGPVTILRWVLIVIARGILFLLS